MIAKIAPALFRPTRPPIPVTLRSSRRLATRAPLGQGISSAPEAPGEWEKANLAYWPQAVCRNELGRYQAVTLTVAPISAHQTIDLVICQAISIAMVGMAGQHRHRPVDLLHQHDSDKLMRPGC